MFDYESFAKYLKRNFMLLTKQITSLDIPALHPYRTLRRPMEHVKDGIFVAEGAKVVQRLLDSDLTIISFLMTNEWCVKLFPDHELPLRRQNNAEQPAIYLAEKELVESIVGYNLHQGIMAIAKLPVQQSLAKIISSVAKPYLIVALDGLVNAENVGLVMRNCAAFGVDAVIVGETSSSPYLRRAVRNSMGTVFTIPIVHADNLARIINRTQDELCNKNYRRTSSRGSISSFNKCIRKCLYCFGKRRGGDFTSHPRRLH